MADDRYDLFVSYSRKDDEANGRIAALVDRIQAQFRAATQQDVRVFFDRTEIRSGDDWRDRIYGALRDSHLLLCCVSPSYLSSTYCEWELVEYLKHEFAHAHGFAGVLPVFIAAAAGKTTQLYEADCPAWAEQLPQRHTRDLTAWYSGGDSALTDGSSPAREMANLEADIVERVQRGRLRRQHLGNVDAHNPHFVGRNAAIKTLHAAFTKPGHASSSALVLINGLGGIGKSALATHYAHAYAGEYGGGRWQVSCAGKADLSLALKSLDSAIGFTFTEEEERDPDRQIDRVRRELQKLAAAGAPDGRQPHSRCLLILDNVDQPSLIAPTPMARLGSGAGDWLHVIATTRLGGQDTHLHYGDRTVIEMDALGPDDAVDLLRVFQPGEQFASDAERTAAREIAQRLDGFTLAVEAAAVYLGRFAPKGLTLAGFARDLHYAGLDIIEHAGQLIGRDALRHREVSLQATLLPVLEALRPEERLTMEYAAVLAPDMMAVSWLRSLVASKYPALARDATPGSVDPWLTVLHRLIDLQLLRWTGASDESGRPRLVRVHRIVQGLTHALPGNTVQLQEGRTQQVLVVARQRDHDLSQAADKRPLRWELEPLTALGSWWADSGQPGAGWLLAQCGLHWYGLADWTRSETALRRALAFDGRTGGTANTNVARDQEYLARVLMHTNRWTEAEDLLRKSLATWQRAKGPEDTTLLPAMSSLGSLLQNTNRVAEAEPLLRGVVKILETELARTAGPPTSDRGPRLDTAGATVYAAALNNLATLLKATNRLSEAEPLMRRALAIDEASYGAEHPKVAIRLSNLASLLKATNRLSEAEPLMRRVVSIFEASLGPQHPNVATALNNLATLLQATNRLSEAEPLKRRALAIDEASYGAEHPEVAIRLSNLAQLLHVTNRLSEAEPLMRRVVTIFEASLGPQHPNVATALNNLATLLQATNRLSEAEPLMRRALAIDEASYGAEHPEVATDLNNLAQLLKATNRLSEAEPLMRRALAIDEASYGTDHPEVAIRLSNLASLLYATNRLSEAEPLMRRALAIDEASYGTAQPEVATRLNNLASLLYATNRLSEAEPLMRSAVTIREHALVPGHPWTLGSMQALADILEALGRAAEAAGWRRRRLTIIAEQPDQTPLALRTLALDAYQLGDYALAATLLERVLAAGFEPASTHCHLARLALLQADDAAAAHHADAAWENRASAEPYVVSRILWLQLACALLAVQASEAGARDAAAMAIRRLKTALSADGGLVEWAMDPVLAALAARLPAADADLLRALVAAMSFPDRTDALDAFPLWRDADPLPIPTT